MSRWVDSLDRWLFAPEPAGRVRAMRAAIAVAILLRLATGPFTELAGQPAALFRPVWFLAWLDEMPPFEVLVGIQVVGVASAILAVLGWRERATFLLAWSSLVVLAGCSASRGKVQHNDLPLLLVGLVLAAAPVGLRWTDERRAARFGWPVRTSILVVTGIYFLTGFHKVVSSGPAWVLSDNLRNVMYAAPFTEHASTDTVARFIADRPWLSHGVALVTVVVELGAVVALVRPRLRVAYVAAVAVLHAGIFLTHGLDYSMWVATAAIVLIDWRPILVRAVTERRPSSAGRGRPWPRTSGRRAAASR